MRSQANSASLRKLRDTDRLVPSRVLLPSQSLGMSDTVSILIQRTYVEGLLCTVDATVSLPTNTLPRELAL